MDNKIENLIDYLRVLESLNKEYPCTARIEKVCNEIEKELGI